MQSACSVCQYQISPGGVGGGEGEIHQFGETEGSKLFSDL